MARESHMRHYTPAQSRYSAPIPSHSGHHHAWWHLTARPRDFQPANPPRPRIHPQDDGAGLGHAIEVALYRQEFNTDLSVTAYEASHERREYWRLPPEIRDRMYSDYKEESLVRLTQNLSMSPAEKYHEAIRGSQEYNTSLPVHLTSPSISHNAQLNGYRVWEQEMESMSPMEYLESRRNARHASPEVFEPVTARPRMGGA